MNHLDFTVKTRLTDAVNGSIVTIMNVNGGDRLRDKLLSMGILPGKKIEILSVSKKGPVIVKINDTRIVIGHGMASKISIAYNK